MKKIKQPVNNCYVETNTSNNEIDIENCTLREEIRELQKMIRDAKYYKQSMPPP